jgi:hypothetical protein
MRFSKKKGRQIASALAPKSIASIENSGCKAKINTEDDEFNYRRLWIQHIGGMNST